MKKRSNKKNCPLCQIPFIFSGFEDLSNNMIEEKTIWKYHKKLLFHLQGIFDFDKTALHCFLDTEFQYKDRDWYTGETWRVSFSDQLDYEEKIKLNEAKKIAG